MRPRRLDEILGQDHLLGAGAPLRAAVERGIVPPMVLWGPPGSGKTSLALLLGEAVGALTRRFNTTTGGVKEARALIAAAQECKQRTLLFVDELHRFSRAQQDSFLPHVEAGTVIFVGATTENPSFQVNAPLLSRVKVFVLKALEPAQLLDLLAGALREERGLAGTVEAEEAALAAIVAAAEGDARRALNTLELAAAIVGPGACLTTKTVDRALLSRVPSQGPEEHFDTISALQKSIRGSDPQGAVYWLTRMLEAGEEPLYLARRLVRTASEDVGLADPRALEIALAAKEAVHFLGMPEGALALVEAAVYLATAPKSNALYKAYTSAQQALEDHGSSPVPLHLRNAPTRLARGLGHGRAYLYDHDCANAYSGQSCLPEELSHARFYEPGAFAFEKEIARRMRWWAKLKAGTGED